MITAGDQMWLHGKPVTVFAIQAHHVYIFPGHHAWTTCHIDDISETRDAK